MATSTLNQLMQSFQKSADTAKAANLKRYNQAMNIYDSVIANYSPGGAFEKASLTDIANKKESVTGGELQQNISSGLYGTTGTQAIGRQFEKDIGAPSRLKMEDIQFQRLSDAQLGKASFLSSAEDVGPDLGLMASLFSQAGNRPTGPGFTEPKTQLRTYGGTYGASSFPSMFSIGGGTKSSGQVGQSAKGTGHRASGGTLPSIQVSGQSSTQAKSSTLPKHVQSFQSYFNYMATVKNKGLGTTKTQQEAFSKLKGSGWTG